MLTRLSQASLSTAFNLWHSKVEYWKKVKRVTIPLNNLAYLQQIEKDLRLKI